MKGDKYRQTIKWYGWIIASAFLCLAVIFGSLSRNVPEDGEAPLHFYYDEWIYIYHGQLVYVLPDEFVQVGMVNNTGDRFTGNNFDGNAEGYVYMNPANNEIAYFQWKEWDESIDGKEPYLTLVRENLVE